MGISTSKIKHDTLYSRSNGPLGVLPHLTEKETAFKKWRSSSQLSGRARIEIEVCLFTTASYFVPNWRSGRQYGGCCLLFNTIHPGGESRTKQRATPTLVRLQWTSAEHSKSEGGLVPVPVLQVGDRWVWLSRFLNNEQFSWWARKRGNSRNEKGKWLM